MIENPKILTGSPAHVEKELAEYLASHPNATVLSSSIATHEELESVLSDPEAKPKAKPKTGKAKTITTVCVIVGIKL